MQLRLLACPLLVLIVGLFGCGGPIMGPGPVGPTPPEDRYPAWSPDGQWIAHWHFDQRDSLVMGLYLTNVAGTDSRQVVEGFALCPDWSPDGKQIAFFAAGGGICVVSVTGDSVRAISSVEGYFPSWSPDGQWIAFDTADLGAGRHFILACVRVDGTQERVISPSDTGSWRNPDWSPDGRRILHTGWPRSASQELYVLDLASGIESRLTADDRYDADPAWSPDGSQIVWSSAPEQSRSAAEVWIMNADGTGRRRVTAGYEPSWSPTGQQLVFTRTVSPDGTSRLFIINADGSGLRQLTR